MKAVFYYRRKRIGTYLDDVEGLDRYEQAKQVMAVMGEMSIGGVDCVSEFTPTQWALSQKDAGADLTVTHISLNGVKHTFYDVERMSTA